MAKNGLFDTHAHYFDPRYGTEGIDTDALLRGLFADTVEGIVNVGTNPETSRLALAAAKRYPAMFAAVGLHPEDCEETADIGAALTQIEVLLQTERRAVGGKIVAVGEIGFDYHWENPNREKQKAVFEAQLDLAEQYGMPVIVHDRDAHGDCFEAVLRHPNVKGVFHSFSGSAELAHELTRRGWYISFSGTISFKNATRVREVASSVPADRLLIETDCPYLAPHPHRGECNHSGYLPFTLAALASAKGMDEETLAQTLHENSCRFFGIREEEIR